MLSSTICCCNIERRARQSDEISHGAQVAGSRTQGAGDGLPRVTVTRDGLELLIRHHPRARTGTSIRSAKTTSPALRAALQRRMLGCRCGRPRDRHAHWPGPAAHLGGQARRLAADAKLRSGSLRPRRNEGARHGLRRDRRRRRHQRLTAAAYLAKAGSVAVSRRAGSAARTATRWNSVFPVSCTAPTRLGWYPR
jgi:hypothetical protein